MTINCHRSAISAYHDFCDGKPVGKHLRVCALLGGVFNERPPQPRYTFIWDVQRVLNNLSCLEDNSTLSDKSLSHKFPMLLALTAASRASAIKHVNIAHMVHTTSFYTFTFQNLHKSWKKGGPPPSVTYYAYSKDKKLCVVAALDEYIKRSKTWRNSKTQLLLGTIRPHNEVVSSTISGWIKEVLKASGIDISIF